ncbi:MAG TPA: lytic murein transglycosylase [Reyranella sp.]|jgi:membrane-bound lytic murein transglycosylase B|nr:lytic murein transglycosylase [Reyranella sp.]
MISRRLLCTALALSPATALAQSGDPKFDAFLRTIRAEALKAGVDAGTLDMALAKVHEVPRVMELARNQPEFKMTFDRYLEIVVSDERVKNGRARLAENRALIQRFSGPAGIPDSTVVALWGIESNYGTRLGDFEVIEALATLVYNNFRAQFFRQQLMAALKILAQGHVSFDNMKGSWAGAMGQCQFIPTSFLAYAADGDGDGRMDIWTNKADVFASVCNYLRRVGWKPGLTWGQEVPAGSGAGQGQRIVRPAGANGPTFLTTANFQAILRWNQSDFFALAVGLLSDKIAAAR